MSARYRVVTARVDASTKTKASVVLENMGLSISDAIRILIVRIANDGCIPFDVGRPHANSAKAITELEAGKGSRVSDVQTLLAELNKDDAAHG